MEIIDPDSFLRNVLTNLKPRQLAFCKKSLDIEMRNSGFTVTYNIPMQEIVEYSKNQKTASFPDRAEYEEEFRYLLTHFLFKDNETRPSNFIGNVEINYVYKTRSYVTDVVVSVSYDNVDNLSAKLKKVINSFYAYDSKYKRQSLEVFGESFDAITENTPAIGLSWLLSISVPHQEMDNNVVRPDGFYTDEEYRALQEEYNEEIMRSLDRNIG